MLFTLLGSLGLQPAVLSQACTQLLPKGLLCANDGSLADLAVLSAVALMICPQRNSRPLSLTALRMPQAPLMLHFCGQSQLCLLSTHKLKSPHRIVPWAMKPSLPKKSNTADVFHRLCQSHSLDNGHEAAHKTEGG